MGGEHPNAGLVAYASPFLKPEISRGIEVGANFRFSDVFTDADSLKFKANYYRNTIEDYIIGQLSDSLTVGGGASMP